MSLSSASPVTTMIEAPAVKGVRPKELAQVEAAHTWKARLRHHDGGTPADRFGQGLVSVGGFVQAVARAI
jgi:hypothetical protein